jgi:hypothetical protein
MQEAIKESIDIASPAIPMGAAADVEVSVRMARMGVKVYPILDDFYNISELRLIHLCGLSACSPSSSARLEA